MVNSTRVRASVYRFPRREVLTDLFSTVLKPKEKFSRDWCILFSLLLERPQEVLVLSGVSMTKDLGSVHGVLCSGKSKYIYGNIITISCVM